jgi:hypothetical protein
MHNWLNKHAAQFETLENFIASALQRGREFNCTECLENIRQALPEYLIRVGGKFVQKIEYIEEWTGSAIDSIPKKL